MSQHSLPGLGSEAPVPARKPFLKPFLFWVFCFVMPASIVFGTLALYVHEFSHGLTALALGGHFLGIKYQASTRHDPSMAYADAWSDHHQMLVVLAGIVVNVILGLLLLRKAFRCDRIVPRLLLFLCAGAFLHDLAYALEGCLLWDSDFDTAVALRDAGSSALRWVLIVLLFPAFGWSIATIARGLFRTWERVFGALSGGRAFGVAVLLSAFLPLPSHRGGEAWIAWLGTGVGYVLLVSWLVRTRQRTLEPAPIGRFAPWGIGLVPSTIVAVVGLVMLYKGISLGTYPDRLVYDLHPERKAVAGISARYGMGDRYGKYRPVHDSQVFVSTAEGSRLLPAPTGEVLDLAWLPDLDRIVVVGWNGVHEVDGRSGKGSVVWKPATGWIEHAGHGPNGQILAVLRDRWGKLQLAPGLYVYDAARSFGQFYEANGTAGSPVFLPGMPVRAAVTIGNDLWMVTWPDEDDGEIQVERREGGSNGNLFYGRSGESSWWWYDGESWVAGSTTVSSKDASHWGAGTEGFFTLKEKGGWQVVSADHDGVRQGPIETSSVKLLQFLDGVPWVALQNGDVRRLDSETAAFRVKYPPMPR